MVLSHARCELTNYILEYMNKKPMNTVSKDNEIGRDFMVDAAELNTPPGGSAANALEVPSIVECNANLSVMHSRSRIRADASV